MNWPGTAASASRDAVLDRVENFLIGATQVAAVLCGDRRAELAARAVLAMTRRARLVVELLAFGDRLRLPMAGCGLRRRTRTAAALGGNGDTCEEQGNQQQCATQVAPYS